MSRTRNTTPFWGLYQKYGVETHECKSESDCGLKYALSRRWNVSEDGKCKIEINYERYPNLNYLIHQEKFGRAASRRKTATFNRRQQRRKRNREVNRTMNSGEY